MSRYCTLPRTLSLGVALAALAFFSGCIVVIPPEESELHGTWELTTEQSTDLTQTLLTFDDRGRLTSASYTIAGVTVTDDAISGTSRVDGNNVTITYTFAGNSVSFTGTFNADKTVITGEAGTEIRLGGITISIDNGAVTLTKQ
jgi:hypothetical protein